MRIVYASVVFMLVWTQLAKAKAPYGMAGCGLGSMVISSDGFMQVFASSTNGTSYNQLFGITSGTSNCVTSKEMAAMNKQRDFMVSNLGDLYRDAAQGDGETLQAFAQVLGCQNDVYPIFASKTQGSIAEIFKSPGSLAVLEKAKGIYRHDESLNQACLHLN